MGGGMLADKDLTLPERRLLEAVGVGRLVDLRADKEEPSDPVQGARWPQHRTVRAEVLVELLTGQRKPPGAPQARMLKLSGARIIGTLDLEAATLVCPLLLRGCSFQKPIRLREARAPAVRLPGCHVPGLEAEALETHGILDISNGFTCHGEVNLVGGRIGGQLYGDGAVLINPSGQALSADWLTAHQGVHCHRLLARGEVRLPGANISGTIEFDGADLTGPEPSKEDEKPVALTADGLSVEGSMFCRAGFTARGEVRLPGAQVDGELVFEGATLTNPGGWALTADGLSVTRNMVCGASHTEGAISPDQRFIANGEVALPGAHIGGQLTFQSARLSNQDGRALTADKLTVDQNMFLRAGFEARGEVRLIGARIGGTISFDTARLVSGDPKRPALNAYRLSVEDDLTYYRFVAEREVRLAGARIGGRLDFDDAHLTNPTGPSLNANTVHAASVSFATGFAALGKVQLRGACLSGQLDFSGASGLGCTDPAESGLDLQQTNIATLFLTPRQPPAGVVDLVGARVGTLIDGKDAWPAAVRLRGLVYDRLTMMSVQERLKWLDRDRDGYSPQPYEQLAAVYRQAGHEQSARRVAIANQWRRRRTLKPLGKGWNWLLWATVGYGYRTWQAGLWLLALLTVGTLVFDHAYPSHMIATKQPTPAFHAPAYTLDVLLPILNLGQQDAWQPQGAALGWSWVLIGAGWVLTTAVVAGLTSILKRD
jgi:hypothetical protein